MGEIYKSTCKACGKSWEYKIGCGIEHCNLDVVLDFFDEEVRNKVRTWASGKIFPRFQFNFHKAVCTTCKDMVGCEECGNKVEIIEDKDNKKCPICGKNELEELVEVLWD